VVAQPPDWHSNTVRPRLLGPQVPGSLTSDRGVLLPGSLSAWPSQSSSTPLQVSEPGSSSPKQGPHCPPTQLWLPARQTPTPAVPAGRYARAWLESIGLWELVEPHVVRGSNVRAALAAVASGGAAFGIVYASDAARFDSVEVVFRVPIGAGPRIEYPGAPLIAAAHPALARRFLDELANPVGPWSKTATELGFRLEP